MASKARGISDPGDDGSQRFAIGFDDLDGGRCIDLGPDAVPPTVTSFTVGAQGNGASRGLFGRQWMLKMRPGEEAAVEADLTVGALCWTVSVEDNLDVQLSAFVYGPSGRKTLEEGRGNNFSGEAGSNTGEDTVPGKLRLALSNRHSWFKAKSVEVTMRPPWEGGMDTWRSGLTTLSTASMVGIPWVSELVEKTFVRKDAALKAFRLEVVQVQRIAHAEHWDKYQRRRAEIAIHLQAAREHMDQEEEDAFKSVLSIRVKSDEYVPVRPMSEANEHWLLHGTSGIAARSIASEAFRKPEKSVHGTAFGEGVYLSESSAKADLYATPVLINDSLPEALEGLSGSGKSRCLRPRRKNDSLCCMLLCRVALGRALVEDTMWPDKARIAKEMSTGKYHSVFGDRERVCKSYREFIVQDADQVNPEFIIWYRRIDESLLQKWKRENLGDVL